MKPYTPKGAVAVLLSVMAKEPDRVWTVGEVARVLRIRSNAVISQLGYAVKARVIFRGQRDSSFPRYDRTVFSLQPFPDGVAVGDKVAAAAVIPPRWNPDGDIRVPRVDALWKPPVMVPPRACR